MQEVKRNSTAVNTLKVDDTQGTALVEFHNGSVEAYTGISSEAINEVVNNELVSLGFWVNEYCLKPAGIQELAAA